jgi:hypothetical protein
MIRTPIAATAVRLGRVGGGGYGAAMSRAVQAGLVSAAAHAAVAAALVGGSHAAPGPAAGMPVEAIAFDAPAVAALPLADGGAAFTPVGAAEPAAVRAVGHVEAGPAEAPAASDPAAPAAATFFGVPAAGRSVVFVIDRSASMGLAGRLERAVRETATSLRRLPRHVRFAVIAYDRSAEPMRFGGLVAAEPAAVEAAVAGLERLTAEGGTDHRRALRAALALGPEVVYFLTDDDELTAADVAAVSAANRGRTAIHAVCLAAPGGRAAALAELARRNRGTFRAAPE